MRLDDVQQMPGLSGAFVVHNGHRVYAYLKRLFLNGFIFVHQQ